MRNHPRLFNWIGRDFTQNIRRRTWAEIDLDAIAYNFKLIQKTVHTKICCVIKADGYGHGAVALAKEYERLGADFFGVSNIDEALQLRQAGVTLPILIFGYAPPADAAVLAANSISQCVYSLDYGAALSKAAAAAGVTVKIHIKADTGMSRLGFIYQEPERDTAAIEEIRQVCALPGLAPEGIFTHFAVADEGRDDFTLKQYANFDRLLSALSDIPFLYRHCANSGAIEDFPCTRLDMVRAGIILYGLSPSSAMRNNLPLRPALSLKSVVSHVKTLEKGADISYGREFTAQKTMRVATVPIGYADGYTRILAQNGACMLVHGRACPIVGRVCMDQLMVDLGDLTNVAIGDVVTIIGRDGDAEITTEQIAALRGTINYEVVCDIGARVPRVYIKDGEEVGIQNYIMPA